MFGRNKSVVTTFVGILTLQMDRIEGWNNSHRRHHPSVSFGYTPRNLHHEHDDDHLMSTMTTTTTRSIDAVHGPLQQHTTRRNGFKTSLFSKTNIEEDEGSDEIVDLTSTPIMTVSQGLVTTLTNLVNMWSSATRTNAIVPSSSMSSSPTTTDPGLKENSSASSMPMSLLSPPQTVEELHLRLQEDYTEKNYLWTGQLDFSCFASQCTFTDPTISFVGVDTFYTNTQNLIPWVEALVTDSESRLLDSMVTDEYIHTRWNMIGTLNGFFWRPQINVIGQTKFWFQSTKRTPTTTTMAAFSSMDGGSSRDDETFLQIYKYDEKWEIPAYQALLQLITPAGTFPNSSIGTTTTTPSSSSSASCSTSILQESTLW